MGRVTENKNSKYVNDIICLKVIAATGGKKRVRIEGKKSSNFKQKSHTMFN